MRAWLTILVLVAACGFPRPADLPGPATGDDASVPADASLCFGSFVRVCFDSAADVPTQPRHFGDDGHSVLINTDVASVCDQHNDQKTAHCVVTGAGMTFAQTISFSAQGSKALVLLSTAAVDLRGAIDISGLIGNGAGADPMGGCTGATPVQGDSGGAGGSFRGRGGNGGIVNAPAGSSAAAPALTAFPAILRGGCSGQAGDVTGCGKVAGNTPSPADAGIDAEFSGNAAVVTQTVLTGKFRDKAGSIDLVSHLPNNMILATATTDANGSATIQVYPGGSVTAVYKHTVDMGADLITWVG